MSAETEDRVRDLVLWYFENRNRIPRQNLEKRLDFMDKAVKCALEVVAMQAKDIQELESRHPRNKLWLPTAVSLDDENSVRLR